MSSVPQPYVLGHATAEHARLGRQGRTLHACTERLLREAGVGPGMRVLDLGSGVGDVALIIAALVGNSGQVVGIDRDATALMRARARLAAAGFGNAEFCEAELTSPPDGPLFDAIVGRFVLMFQPDPVATLRALKSRLRPGGVLVLQEPSWASYFALVSHLPLRSACGRAICETFRAHGANPDMVLTLHRGFQSVELAPPCMRIETLIAREPDDRRWLYELVLTLLDKIPATGGWREALGPMETLAERLDAELIECRSCAPLVGLVGAWSRAG